MAGRYRHTRAAGTRPLGSVAMTAEVQSAPIPALKVDFESSVNMLYYSRSREIQAGVLRDELYRRELAWLEDPTALV